MTVINIPNSFAQYHKKPGLVLEGGLYGHMGHIYEDHEMQFETLNNMVLGLLSGEIDGEIKEKIDGQALAVSIDEDSGDVIFARNVGNVKNFGENGLKSWRGVYDKFSDVATPEQKESRRDLIKAFTFAARDLSSAIEKLPGHVKDQHFKAYDSRVPKLDKNGNYIKDRDGNNVMETVKIKNWLHFEIVWPETTNVIPYNHRMIVLHNYVAYDILGKKRLTNDFNEFAQTIQTELKNVGATKQKYFDIAALSNMNWNQLKSPGSHTTLEDFTAKRDEFLNRIKKIQNEFSLTDRNTIGDYYTGRLVDMIYDAAESMNYRPPSDLVNTLVDRWLNDIKKPSITDIKKMIRKGSNFRMSDPGADPSNRFADWVAAQDSRDAKNHMLKNIKKPLRDVVMDLGIEVISNMADYLALGTLDDSRYQIKKSIEQVVRQVKQTRNEDHINQIENYLDQIQRAGGLDKIVPTEGIMFTYKKPGEKTHSVYKLTGSFPAINNLAGFFKFRRGAVTTKTFSPQ